VSSSVSSCDLRLTQCMMGAVSLLYASGKLPRYSSLRQNDTRGATTSTRSSRWVSKKAPAAPQRMGSRARWWHTSDSNRNCAPREGPMDSDALKTNGKSHIRCASAEARSCKSLRNLISGFQLLETDNTARLYTADQTCKNISCNIPMLKCPRLSPD